MLTRIIRQHATASAMAAALALPAAGYAQNQNFGDEANQPSNNLSQLGSQDTQAQAQTKTGTLVNLHEYMTSASAGAGLSTQGQARSDTQFGASNQQAQGRAQAGIGAEGHAHAGMSRSGKMIYALETGSDLIILGQISQGQQHRQMLGTVSDQPSNQAGNQEQDQETLGLEQESDSNEGATLDDIESQDQAGSGSETDFGTDAQDQNAGIGNRDTGIGNQQRGAQSSQRGGMSSDPASMVGQEVRVSGQLHSKQGLQYMVVSSIEKQSAAGGLNQQRGLNQQNGQSQQRGLDRGGSDRDDLDIGSDRP